MGTTATKLEGACVDDLGSRPELLVPLLQSMAVVLILALDFAMLPPHLLLWLIPITAVISLFGVGRNARVTDSSVMRKNLNIRLLAGLAAYAVINVSAAGLAIRVFGEGGMFVLVFFATWIPACLALAVSILRVSRRTFGSLTVFSFLNAVAIIARANYLFGVAYSSAT